MLGRLFLVVVAWSVKRREEGGERWDGGLNSSNSEFGNSLARMCSDFGPMKKLARTVWHPAGTGGVAFSWDRRCGASALG